MEGTVMPKMAEGARKLTHADYLLFPDDGRRHELIDGEHFVTPSPRSPHQRAVENLFLLIGPYVREHRLGRLALSPFDVIFSDYDVVEPDLIFVHAERLGIIEDWVRGVPDLVIEILSPTGRRHDEVRKRALYERFGVEEYWVVDLDAETVKVYRLEDERYGRPRLFTVREGDVLESPVFPGLEVPVAAVFEEG
jgi:Uma2 family endonuclease